MPKFLRVIDVTRRSIRKTWNREEGGITVLSLFIFMIMILVTGFALDVNNAIQARAQLQGAADAAGHAALVERQDETEGTAVATGRALAAANMPTGVFGDIMLDADVEFGKWNPNTRVFTATPGATDAVRVTARRVAGRGNSVRTFLLKLVGQPTLELNQTSVWYRLDGFCNGNQGFFAVGIVDIQSNNDFNDGFCIHSETHVEFNNHNDFEDGTTVSMPDKANLVTPAGGFSKNPGLEDALKSDSLPEVSDLIADIPNIIANLGNPGHSTQESYITDPVINFVPGNTVTNTNYKKGAVNVYGCSGGTLNVAKNTTVQDAVIITDCALSFGKDAVLTNATLITNDTSAMSVKGSGGSPQVGSASYCTTQTGGATIITRGGMHFSAKFQGYGANLIAAGDIHASAQANGLAGVRFIAGGRIDNTSNNSMGFCGFGPPEPEFIPPVFRMVF